jgi:glycine cleavage system H protein
MHFPENLKYTKEHEWILVEGDQATVGITEFAQSELGDIIYVELPQPGKEVKKDDVFGTVEAVKTVSDLFMPVSGKVLETNKQLDQTPELVNEDPYGQAWMIKIELSDPSQLNDLLTQEEYRNIVGY